MEAAIGWMEPNEVEFIAEKELVTVVPNFSESKLSLISVSMWTVRVVTIIILIQGDIGPFNPSMPVQVPVWLAINLKQKQRCRIQAPDWLNVGQLPCNSNNLVYVRLFLQMC